MGVRYSVDETFFDTWSPEMAYVLGYMYADGSLEDARYIRGKYVRVTSTDFDRIEAIKRTMRSEHTIVTEHPTGNRKLRYLLRIGNAALYDSLAARGLTPRKSLTMSMPNIPTRYFGAFARGYFDGDGCVYTEISAAGGPKRLLTVFTSGSRIFLEQLHSVLRTKARVEGSGLYSHGSTPGAYQLRYSTSDSARLFKLMYPPGVPAGLSLQRKYDIFIRYFEMQSRSPRSRLKLDGLVAKKSTRRSAKPVCEGANPSQASNAKR